MPKETKASSPAEIKKIYDDPEDLRSLKSGIDWYTFLRGLSVSVAVAKGVHEVNEYNPDYSAAKLNDDGSISFFIHTCNNQPCATCKEGNKFQEALKENFILGQLDYRRKELGYDLLGNSGQLLEVNPSLAESGYNLIEYKLNISPKNLDSILKEVPSYAYRNSEGLGILNLVKNCALKPDVIRLFPVFPLDRETGLLRGAGCQLIEMPTVQLLQLIPSYDGIEKPFHWVPSQVEDEFGLTSSNYDSIISDLLAEQKLTSAKAFLQGESGQTPLAYGPGLIRFVGMSAEDIDFYQTYGNCTAEELKACQSAEISRVDFLSKMQDFIKNKITDILAMENPSDEDLRNADRFVTNLEKIEKVIEIEHAKAKARLPSMRGAPTLFAAPVSTVDLSPPTPAKPNPNIS